jgi:hypothetical protein
VALGHTKPTFPRWPFHSQGNAALHNACVQVPDPQSTVALFVALTRAVREAEVHDDVRIRAYDVIDRMAQTVGQTGCRVELEALAALASEHAQMHLALQPFWDDLLALVPKQ